MEPKYVNITEIFTRIQTSTACHLQSATILKRAMETSNDDEIFKEMCKCLRISFLENYQEKSVFVHRIIQFTARLAISFTCHKKTEEEETETDPTLTKILHFVLELSHSASDSYRYWSCLLFNQIFTGLEELSDDLFEEIRESMLERLRDPKAAIRSQAIIALHRLQDPTDKQDPIIEALCKLVNSDPNAKVRQLCVEKLALNKQVMPIVLKRITDVNAEVRMAVFQKFETIASCLKVSQRRLVLQCGFYDSSEKINKFVTQIMLDSWLESYENNYLKFMKSIRFDACEEDIKVTVHFCELALNALFKPAAIETILRCIQVNEKKVMNFEDLNWESVLYYRIVIQFLRRSDSFDDYLNSILPDLIHFCPYIKAYSDFTKKENYDELLYQFTLEQFFLICEGYDVSDAASRQCLNSLVHHMLQNEELTVSTARVILRNLEKTIASVTDRCMFVCEMISNVVYGKTMDYEEVERIELERSLFASQLQSDIITLQEQEKHFALVEKNFLEADRVKQEIEWKQSQLNDLKSLQEKPEEIVKTNDVPTLLKCLTIAEALLLSPTIRELNPALSTLCTEIIKDAMTHEDDGVKAKALKCYALCCIVDHNTAKYGIHLFSGLLFSEDLTLTEILITSIKAIVDMITIFGLALIENNEDELSDSRQEDVKKVFIGGTSLTDVIQVLADHLDHEDLEVQLVATKGVCILLMDNRVTSSSLLSRIIIKWANPATECEKLKQLIGSSLTEIVKSPDCKGYFGEAVLTTIRTLCRAPKKSPLADIDIDNIVKFLVTLCQTTTQASEIQMELALKMCNLMREKPKLKATLYYSKALTFLTLPQDENFEELLAICDELRDVIRESPILRNIGKFVSALTKHAVKLPPVEELSED